MRHSTLPLFSLLLISCFLFLSFSVEQFAPPVKRQATPSMQKTHKKLDRLERRLARTQRSAVKQRLQLKIQRIKGHTHDGHSRILSILSLVAGILAIGVFFLSYAFPIGAPIALFIAIGSIVFAIAGLAMSIGALLLIRHAGDDFGGKGFAIAGLIVSSLVIGVVIVGFAQAVFDL